MVRLMLALLGAATALVSCNERRPPVSRECRDVVAVAAVNVDAWRYIGARCSNDEQQALLEEFRERGLSTEAIERSRSAGKAGEAAR